MGRGRRADERKTGTARNWIELEGVDMVVEVKLFAMFREGRFAKERVEVAGDCRLSGLLGQLGIAVGEVGILLVNGRAAKAEDEVAEDDVVSIFPLIAGG